jgi:hypothetical protein
VLKKLFVAIFFFISNSLVAQTIKPLTNYSFEELLNDENANHFVLEGCISLIFIFHISLLQYYRRRC